MTNVIEMMTSLYPVSDDTIQLLKDNVTLCHFPKKYQLIKANQYSRSAYFIEKGMTRSYWLVNGEEITTSFSCEGGIVFSMDELYYNKMSEEFVETLEDVVAYKIALSDLIRLFQTNIELANWGRVIHTDACTVRTKTASPCLQKKDMKHSNFSFLKCASGYNWDISPLIWASHFQHSAASEHTNNSHIRQDFDAGQFFKLINSVFLRLLQ